MDYLMDPFVLPLSRERRGAEERHHERVRD
jgi:hypothetical protein